MSMSYVIVARNYDKVGVNTFLPRNSDLLRSTFQSEKTLLVHEIEVIISIIAPNHDRIAVYENGETLMRRDSEDFKDRQGIV